MLIKSTSSSHLITIILIVGILLFSGLTVYISTQSFRREQDSLRKYADSQMRTLVMDLDSKVMAVESAMVTRSHTSHVAVSDSVRIYKYLEDLISDLKFVENAGLDVMSVHQKDTSFYVLYVTEVSDSVYIHNYYVDDGTLNEEAEDVACFFEALESGEPEWSLPYEDNIFADGGLVTTCYTKIDGLNAAICIDIEVASMLEMMDKLQFYDGSQLYIQVPSSGKYYTLEEGNLVCIDDSNIHDPNYTEISAFVDHLDINIINEVPIDAVQRSMWDTVFWGLLIAIAGLVVLAVLVHLSFNRAQKDLKKTMDKSYEEEMALSHLENEISIAARIQEKMLNDPDKPVCLRIPEVPVSDLLARIIPAKDVGGDLYEYSTCGDLLYMCVGDVSGKGIPASIVMTRCGTLFHGFVSNSPEASPSEIMAFMNEQLCRHNEDLMFVTLWAGILNLRTGNLKYASAGHNPPVLIDNGSSSFLEMKQGLPLGMFDDAQYELLETDIKPGQSLVLYTDGITEAEGARYELFGEERLLAACASVRSVCPEVISDGILRDVRKHVAGRKQSDDITLLCLTFQGNCAQLRGIDDVAALHELVFACGCADPDNAALALEEAAVNAFEHGGATFVCAEYADGWFTLTDNGGEFDTTAYEPKASDGLDVGGRGILLMRQLCSEMSYERTADNYNRLKLKI